MKLSWRIAICLFIGSSAFAQESIVNEKPAIEKDLDIVASEQMLGYCLEQVQRQYFPVCLPSLTERLIQPAGSFPIDFNGFDPRIRKLFQGWIDDDFIVRYSVGLYEDYWTGEVVVLDANAGWELFRIPRSKSYDPFDLQRELFGLGEKEVLENEFMRSIFLPCKIATVVELVPIVFWDAHMQIELENAAQERLLASKAITANAPEKGDAVAVSISMAPSEVLSSSLATSFSAPLPLDGGGSDGGGAGTNLEVTLTISLPENFGHMNHIEIFAKDDLVYSPSWELPADGEWIPTYGSQTVVWTDSESTNKTQRFYLVSDGADSDGDGHSNLYEAWVGNTLSNSFNVVNVDGDDLHDWLEWKIFGNLSQTGTNDFDSDGLLNNEELVSASANQPAIMLSDPTLYDSDNEGLNDFQERRVWKTNPFDSDTDGDGFDDAAEVLGTLRTDPNNPDIVAPNVVFS